MEYYPKADAIFFDARQRIERQQATSSRQQASQEGRRDERAKGRREDGNKQKLVLLSTRLLVH
ncbi:MAG: hypothetical protein LBK92_03310 [Endomicrobium sp.]|nr:hypothetical protein [Endomicrobium sp.]